MSEELLITLGVQDKNASAQIRALENNIKSLDRQIKLASGSGKLMSMNMQQLTTHYTQMGDKMKNMQTQLRSYKTRLSEANENIARQKSLMNELSAAGQEGTTQYAKAASQLDRYRATANNTENGIKELQLKIQNLNNEISQTKHIMDNFSAIQLGNKLVGIGSNLENTGTKIQNVGKGLGTLGNTITSLSAPFTAIAVGAATAAISYESAFAGVRKTTNATEQEFKVMSDQIRAMAKEMPTSANQIASVVEIASQLGVAKESVVDFAKVMAQLGDATNLGAEEAATAIAHFMNVTGYAGKTATPEFNDAVQRLGSTLVDLGNNTATTEADIMNMASRLGAAGYQVGMSQAQILALSAGLSSLGLASEMGGSAFSKLMVNMQVACANGGDSLEDFASVCGMTGGEFKQAFETDAYGAIVKFTEGLANGGETGESAIKILSDMGIEEVRLRDAVLRATNAHGLFTDTLNIANNAWAENSALTNEVQQRYQTTASQIQICKNKMVDLGISLGEKLLPHISKFLDKASELVEWFGNLSEGTQSWILKIGILGPLVGGTISLLGKFVTGIGTVTKAFGSGIGMIGNWVLKMAGVSTTAATTSTALGGIGTAAASSTGSVSGLSTVMGALTSTTGLVTVGVVGVAAALGGLALAWHNNNKKCEEGAKQLSEAGFVAEDLKGKVKGTANVLDKLFGHEYDIKFSDNYKNATAKIEENVQNWANRLKEMQQNIQNILNNTEITPETKQDEVKALVQPWIDETNQGAQTIAQNMSEMDKSVVDYAKKAFGEGSKSYNEFLNSYSKARDNYKQVYDSDTQQLLEIYSKLGTGEIQMTEETQARILDLIEDRKEAEKRLSMTSSEDYLNQLELDGEKERAVYEDKIKNIQKYTDSVAEAKEKENKTWAESAIKQAEALYMAGSVSKETYTQMLDDIAANEQKLNELAQVSANSYGLQALYSKDFADQHGLHVKQVEGDIQGLYQVYDSNGHAMRTVFADNEAALQQYAATNGMTCKTVTNETGAMTMVVVDSYGNVQGQLANNEWAWKNNAAAVVNALNTEINSVKNGQMTTSQAMEIIKAKLAEGSLKASDFGFATQEGFLRCAEQALNAKGDVDSLKSSVNNLPHTTTITVTDNGTAKDVQWRIDGIHGKSVTVTVNQVPGTVVQHTRGGSFTINEQGTHGQVGSQQLAKFNESWRGSKSWELIDGNYVDLGNDGKTSRALLGVGASIKSNATSTKMMMNAVKDEVTRQVNKMIEGTYMDYGVPSSPMSQMAFNISNGGFNQSVSNNFDDSNIVNTLFEVIKAISGINMNPTVSFNPKQTAQVLTPYIDRQLEWNRKHR